ncbi:dihydrolipoyllysine-residue acetyltransferase [Dyella terrae]|uniref:Acetyltransferase component of pyruvate dehydrogenase complex n=4 Tax=Dyella TaxID=231454 RepID=A0A4V2NMM6_9GAMM|nr:dihydrolipoyllysine-residue acetyltransferase [Dyella terrae]TCI13847.1 dihydrolipoyllysine-residue acetyltransferase [Dyella soli]
MPSWHSASIRKRPIRPPCDAEAYMNQLKEIRVPDLGGAQDVPVIELLVNVGDRIAVDQGIMTLESDKATMEVPSSTAGILREWKARLGDTLSEGNVIALIEVAHVVESPPGPVHETPPLHAPPAPSMVTAVAATTIVDGDSPCMDPLKSTTRREIQPSAMPYASPSVRQLARTLGVSLGVVSGTGRSGRIMRVDVETYVRGALSGVHGRVEATSSPKPQGGLNLLPWPRIDFSKFGDVEEQPLQRIRNIASAHLSRSWAFIPHVTQHDEADVTDLEDLRLQLNRDLVKDGTKLTLLAFLIKACGCLLKRFPRFNASLDERGDMLTLKKYCHIGFAAETPQGLVVPVVRDVAKKGIVEIAQEVAALAARARASQLAPNDMQGGCFSISSLGGIGGSAFTPMVNAPEVAILGVSRSSVQPVWDGVAFQPRRLLPLSLSYDHRVIDGAAAARFTTELARLLGDFRRALL